MIEYRIAGQDFHFSCPVPEMDPFETQGTAEQAVPFVPPAFLKKRHANSLNDLPLLSQSVGWVAGADRLVKLFEISAGYLIQVAGCGDYFIAPHGETISKAGQPGELSELSDLDRQVITGPALVLALALRRVWSLHASAARYKEKVFVFLGESGQGKSTLAAYLATAGWQLVSDDILPVTCDSSGMLAWPHFPQLKIPAASQPGPHLPESLPLATICLLLPAGNEESPEMGPISVGETVKALLAHTAGARLFTPELLSRHLDFCTRSASRVTACRLTYPHRREALPVIQEILENTC
jgi:hypothetical protein